MELHMCFHALSYFYIAWQVYIPVYVYIYIKLYTYIYIYCVCALVNPTDSCKRSNLKSRRIPVLLMTSKETVPE